MRTVSGDLPAALLPDFIENPDDPIRALIVVSGNPLLSVGGDDRLRRAFEELDLIVTVDLYRTVTGEMADYILPATDWLEREDVNFLNTMGVAMEPYVQYTPAVVPAKGERRDDWWILSRIQQEMGVSTLLDEPDPDPFAAVDATMRESGLSVEALKAMPCQTAVLPEAEPSHVFSIAVQHDDGLIDCCPELFRRSYRTAERIFEELAAEPADQLKLITRRTNFMVNSWLHNLPVFKQGVHQSNPLWMNPEDARCRGLVEGDDVTVRNRHGEVDAVLCVRRHPPSRSGGDDPRLGAGHCPGAGRRAPQSGCERQPARAHRPRGLRPAQHQSHLTGINVEVRPRVGFDRNLAGFNNNL